MCSLENLIRNPFLGKGEIGWREYGAQGIAQAVAEHYQTTFATLRSKKRTARIARARHVAMYLVRFKLGWSTTEVGILFARDHSSVVSGCNKIIKSLSAIEIRGVKKRLRHTPDSIEQQIRRHEISEAIKAAAA